MPSEFIIGSEKQILNQVRKLPANAAWQWCYFGINMGRKERLREKLTSARRYHYAPELYELSRSLKQPFLDWMTRVNSQHQNDLKWWAMRFASKSPFQTNFFLLVCYFNLVDSWLAGQAPPERQLLMIVVEDPYLHRLLAERSSKYDSRRVQVKASVCRILRAGVYYWAKSLLVPFTFLSRQLRATLKNQYVKIKFRDRLHLLRKLHKEVIINTFIEERSFRENGFHDYYMGQLAEYYEGNGKKVAISSQTNLAVALKKKALISGINFCLTDLYLKTADWLRVLFKRPSVQVTKDARIFKGVDYTLLFVREFNREKSSLSFSFNLCEYYAYRNYFADNKQIKLFVYLFENQPWEKMTIMALRAANPHCKCAGYQHSTVPIMLMNYFLGAGEYQYIPLPDYIITNGNYNEKIMAAAGYKSTKILNGGSLRYAKKTDEKNHIRKRKSGETLKVLVLLTFSLPYSLEIIYGVKNMFYPESNCRYYVRPHPNLFNGKIEKAIQEIDNMEIIQSGSMDEVLAEMDIVVYSTTTAALEALYKGLSVYKVATELIDLDLLEDLNIKKHYNSDKYLPESRMPYFCYDSQVELSFNYIIGEPVRKDTWLALLQN